MAQEESDNIEKENGPLISNTEKFLFHPGQTVVLRIIWKGRILEARPEIVVRDTPELLAFYMPPGVNWVRPRTKEGKRISPQNRARLDYLLTEDKLVNFHRLRLAIPDADYSVLIFWNASDMQQRDWYINLEETLHRTQMGFDYTDHFLDVIVQSDLSGWYWKDEDELAEAVDLGLISEDRAAALYREGEKAAGWIQSGKSPFNGWEKWRPDPAWKVPVLPDGWDKI